MQKIVFLSTLFISIFYHSFTFPDTSVRKVDDKLMIEFTNNKAKKIYNYLSDIYSRDIALSGNAEHREHVISECGMSKHYLSSPAITCHKTSGGVYGRSEDDDSPDLYSCTLNIGEDGKKENP